MNDTADTPIRILQGDCREVLRTISSDAVDFIFTSPPYADNRRKTYGGIPPDEYVDWFLPIGGELLRVLKPTGTFILNIKEKVVNGERHTYVIEPDSEYAYSKSALMEHRNVKKIEEETKSLEAGRASKQASSESPASEV